MHSLGLNLSKDMEFLDSMDSIERSTIVTGFLKMQQPIVIELFTYAMMPLPFAKLFEQHRAIRTVREAFRRTLLYFYPPPAKPRLIDQIITHIRHTGSYLPTDLPLILQRKPTESEAAQVKAFFAQLTDEDLRQLLLKQIPVNSTLEGQRTSNEPVTNTYRLT